MRGAISKKAGFVASLAGQSGRYGEVQTGTKAKAGHSQPEATACCTSEGRVSTK